MKKTNFPSLVPSQIELERTFCINLLYKGADVGFDEGTNVSAKYSVHGNEFKGKIKYVTIDLK